MQRTAFEQQIKMISHLPYIYIGIQNYGESHTGCTSQTPRLVVRYHYESTSGCCTETPCYDVYSDYINFQRKIKRSFERKKNVG